MYLGGLEEYAILLADALQTRGHPVAILAAVWVPPRNPYRQFLRQKGIPFVWPVTHMLEPAAWVRAGRLALGRRQVWQMPARLGTERRLDRLFWQYWRRRWQPDLLHVHGYATGPHPALGPLLGWARADGVPVAYQEHQTPEPQFGWWRQAGASINRATCVLASSQASARALRQLVHIERPTFVLSAIVADPAPALGREALALPQQRRPLTIGAIARLAPYKGLPHLLEAFVGVRQIHPDVRLRVYGDGPLRSELLRRAQSLGLDGAQIFAGAFERRDLTRVLLQMDLFVLPSVGREALPAAVIEAMAHGRPIVATAVGGVPDLIQDGISGLLCPPADPVGLARRLLELIEHPDRRVRLGEAARRAYEIGPFHPDLVCERHLAVYRETIAIAQAERRTAD